jgi:thymidylate synthase
MMSDDFQIGPNGAYEHVGNELDMQYQDLLQHILDNGVEKKDRTGTGTLSVFGHQIRHNMKDGFPLLTTKKMAWKTMVTELLWFLKGDTNIKYLVDNNCHIWDGDAYKSYENKYYKGEAFGYKKLNDSEYSPDLKLSQEEFINKIKTDNEFAKKWGELGPIYGKQWRKWNCLNEGFVNLKEGEEIEVDLNCINISHQVDQIANLISELKTNPDSRRLMVNAWNVGELDQMVLPPCHFSFQCYSHEENGKRYLSLAWNQRSVDVGLGLPFNIASYGLLLEIIAQEVGMIPYELIGNLGDCHIYNNHIDGIKEQLTRTPYELPKLIINTEFWRISSMEIGDFKVENYQSHPSIKLPLSN